MARTATAFRRPTTAASPAQVFDPPGDDPVTSASQVDPPVAAPSIRQVAKSGRFTFVAKSGFAPPPPPPKASAAAKVTGPLKDFFDTAAHNDTLFMPDAYWMAPVADGGRGIKSDKVTPAHTKMRVRAAFNKWVKEDASRANRSLLMVAREVGDTDADQSVFAEPGMSVWIQLMSPEEAEAAQKAKADFKARVAKGRGA